MNLKFLRLKKGLTQQELAKIVGVDRVTIARYENESIQMTAEKILDISIALDTTPDELLGFQEAYKKYTQYLMSFGKEKDPD